MKIVTIIGARPQFIKAATVSRIIKKYENIKEIIVHTGQHYDSNMSDVFFTELDIPKPDYYLEAGSGSHAVQTGIILSRVEEVLIKEKPDWVLVYGDTNSTIAGALAAVKIHIKTAHVEAGLRSFNRKMPEEINRIATDAISDILFAPTQTAMINLQKEGLSNNAILSGDVMYDSILYYQKKINENPDKYKLKSIPELYYLATVHRAENTDNIDNLKNILIAFSLINENIIWPVHPRTRKILTNIGDLPTNIKLIDPLGYLEMLSLLSGSIKVLTDSGGLQKEAYFLNKPCITMREETEWVETLKGNRNIITGANSDLIVNAVNATISLALQDENLFGDGNASKIIIDAMNNS